MIMKRQALRQRLSIPKEKFQAEGNLRKGRSSRITTRWN